MQGASPLASPGLNPRGTYRTCQAGARSGALPLAGRGAFRHPAGGVLSLSPADLAFSLIFCPHPPVPLPGGKGETQSFLMQGASPLASPGLNPRGTYRTCQAGARSGALPLAGRGWVAFRYPAGGRGACPLRHLLSLPRGRGPSQTPKFLSPGPPSPWLPALLVGNRLLPFSRRTVGTAPGDARGEAPCIK